MRNAISYYKKNIDMDWTVVKEEYVSQEEADWETIFTLSNGYVGIRGSSELPSSNRMPAMYFAGVYDKPDRPDNTEVFGVNIRNKAITPSYAVAPIANLMEIYIEENSIDLINCKVKDFKKYLDMKRGILFNEYCLEDHKGRITKIQTMMIVSKKDIHLAVLKAEVIPVNYDGNIVIRFINKLNTDPQYIHRIKDYTSKTDLKAMYAEDHAVMLHSRVSETGMDICLASWTIGDGPKTIQKSENSIMEVFCCEASKDASIEFTKYIAFYTGRDCINPAQEAMSTLIKSVQIGEETILKRHYETWAERWSISNIEVEGDQEAQRGLRWCIFNLIQLGSDNDSDVSISATGLHGQGYFGHVFWDTEIFMLPFYLAVNPKVAANLLLYRYNRLDAARENAKENGLEGAKYPWTSTWQGYNVTPPDWEQSSNREIHICGDIAYAFKNYLNWTGDYDFYKKYGIEVIVETAKFYASWARKGEDGKYHIMDVTGPDEYNTRVDDNYFTNYLAAWNIKEALSSMQLLESDDPEQYHAIAERTGWNDALKEKLEEVVRLLHFPETRNNVNEQHAGFFQLKDVEEIKRDQYYMPIDKEYSYTGKAQVSKQADVVMMHYLFPDDFSEDVKKASFEYYEKRCKHGSSLSPSIHCIVGKRLGYWEHAYGYFILTALLDLNNLHLDKNLKDGIHAACAGGTWAAAVYGFGGVSLVKGQLHINPVLPEEWSSLKFAFIFRRNIFRLHVTRNSFQVTLEGEGPADIVVNNVTYKLNPGQEVSFATALKNES